MNRKDKKDVVHVQVQLPSELHEQVNRVLTLRKISWQKALIAAVHLIQEEECEPKKKLVVGK